MDYKKMTVGERIKFLRDLRQVTQETLADHLGVNKSTVSRWENISADKMPIDHIYKMSKIFGVTTGFIFEGFVGTMVQGYRIPVLGVIRAGLPMAAIENITDWEEIPYSWVSGDNEFFGLTVRGDSMLPEYREGDVIICRKTPLFESGDDCIVIINGDDATLKRVNKTDSGIMLRPLNSAYEPTFYSADRVNEIPVEIAGIVVELRRKRTKRGGAQ